MRESALSKRWDMDTHVRNHSTLMADDWNPAPFLEPEEALILSWTILTFWDRKCRLQCGNTLYYETFLSSFFQEMQEEKNSEIFGSWGGLLPYFSSDLDDDSSEGISDSLKNECFSSDVAVPSISHECWMTAPSASWKNLSVQPSAMSVLCDWGLISLWAVFRRRLLTNNQETWWKSTWRRLPPIFFNIRWSKSASANNEASNENCWNLYQIRLLWSRFGVNFHRTASSFSSAL